MNKSIEQVTTPTEMQILMEDLLTGTGISDIIDNPVIRSDTVYIPTIASTGGRAAYCEH